MALRYVTSCWLVEKYHNLNVHCYENLRSHLNFKIWWFMMFVVIFQVFPHFYCSINLVKLSLKFIFQFTKIPHYHYRVSQNSPALFHFLHNLMEVANNTGHLCLIYLITRTNEEYIFFLPYIQIWYLQFPVFTVELLTIQTTQLFSEDFPMMHLHELHTVHQHIAYANYAMIYLSLSLSIDWGISCIVQHTFFFCTSLPPKNKR
jgi:hypothetical protein